MMTRITLPALPLAPALAIAALLGAAVPAHAQAPAKKPSILVIFGDDIGISQVSACTMGLMGYRTPNIDRIANEGALFTAALPDAGRLVMCEGDRQLDVDTSPRGRPRPGTAAPDSRAAARHRDRRQRPAPRAARQAPRILTSLTHAARGQPPAADLRLAPEDVGPPRRHFRDADPRLRWPRRCRTHRGPRPSQDRRPAILGLHTGLGLHGILGRHARLGSHRSLLCGSTRHHGQQYRDGEKRTPTPPAPDHDSSFCQLAAVRQVSRTSPR